MVCKTQQGPGRVSNPVHPTTDLDGVHIYHRNAVAAVCRRADWVNYYVVVYITVNGAATLVFSVTVSDCVHMQQY